MITFKYEEIFNHYADAIEKGIFETGQKLNSLRKSSEQFNCSLSVTMQAYEELECQGYIRSVEKSGFYILPRKKENLPEPQKYEHSLKVLKSYPINGISQIMEISQRSDFLPLAATIPDLSILGVKKISSIISRNARNDLYYLNHYSQTNGELALREEISRYMLKKGVAASSEEIIVTNGCTEALFLAISNVSSPGDTIIIESPAYLGIVSMLEHLKRNVIEIPTRADKGMDLHILEKVLETEKVKAVVVSPVFQNPLGFTMSEADKKVLYDYSEKFNFSIIEDDIYGDCSFIDKTFSSIKSFDESGRVLYCSSFSKTLAPGLRIGWIIPGKFHKEISSVKHLSGLGSSILIERSVAEYLHSGAYEYHLKYFRKKIASQTNEIRSLVESGFPGQTKISTPEGGYFLWIELEKDVDSYDLFQWACDHKIGIVPGPVYSASGKFRNCIRLSCGSPVTDKTRRGINILGQRVKDIISFS